MRGFVEISIDEFLSEMSDMGFEEVNMPNCYERTWEFGIDERLRIRIYSTLNEHGETRTKGSDAIRCVLVDGKTRKILHTAKRVHRTQNALPNMRERCRDLYRLAKRNKCTCGGMLVERDGVNGKFMGCSDYPNCKKTRNIK